MSIGNAETLAKLSSTAVATYGGLAAGINDEAELESALQSLSSGAPFVAQQAKDFVERYKPIDQLPNVPLNGFSASVFEDKQTGRRVIAMRGTEANELGQLLLDGLVTDGLGIAGTGFANGQAVEMYRYYRRLTTAGGQAVSYSESEALQLFAIANPTLMRVVAGAPVLSLALAGTFAIFRQQLAAERGVTPPPGSPGLSVLSATEQIDVTGHSLGGHLAQYS